MLKSILTVLAGCILSSTAGAQNARLGEAIVGGPGCPQGSVSVSLTEDQSTISVLFSNFTTSYAVASGQKLKQIHTNCRIQIPVELPPGYAMDVMNLEYRGFYAVPDRAFFMLQTTGLRVGKFSTTQPQQTSVKGPIQDNYQIVHRLIRMISSECKNPKFVLDFTIGMTVQSPGGKFGQPPLIGDAMATLDSLDSTGAGDGAGAYLGVALKRCK